MKKRFFVSAAFLIALCLSGCAGASSSSGNWGIVPVAVSLDYGNVTPVSISAPAVIHNRSELSEFMDWCVFYGNKDVAQYVSVSDEYAQTLREDAYTEFRWAGQYGNLAHNFAVGYDASRLDENLFGIYAGFVPYGMKNYVLSEDNVRVLNYEYYSDILSAPSRECKLSDFALYKHNNGFVRAENSEQLFYAAAQGYMPIAEEGSDTAELLSQCLGILNEIIQDGMSQMQMYCAIYEYLICENTYDYDSFHFKDSEHTDYAAYFIEGVLRGHNAVCDGIVKTAVLMCRLAGIEAYHIGAVGAFGGHAYLYVKIDGEYYLSCPTQASTVTRVGDKKYHTHTYSYFLTDYYTSSPSWDYESEQLPEIAEQIKQADKYDYWQKQITVSDKLYTLSPESAEDAVAVLQEVGETAVGLNAAVQIELKVDYETSNEALELIERKYEVTKINNGVFGGSRLYTFLFTGVRA